MRKLVSVLMTIIILIGLCGCGGDEKSIFHETVNSLFSSAESPTGREFSRPAVCTLQFFRLQNPCSRVFFVGCTFKLTFYLEFFKYSFLNKFNCVVNFCMEGAFCLS